MQDTTEKSSGSCESIFGTFLGDREISLNSTGPDNIYSNSEAISSNSANIPADRASNAVMVSEYDHLSRPAFERHLAGNDDGRGVRNTAPSKCDETILTMADLYDVPYPSLDDHSASNIPNDYEAFSLEEVFDSSDYELLHPSRPATHF